NIPKDLLEPDHVAEDHRAFGAEEEGELQAALLDVGGDDADRLAQPAVHVDPREIESHLAVHEAREIEQVVDEMRLEADVVADELENFPHLVRELRVL